MSRKNYHHETRFGLGMRESSTTIEIISHFSPEGLGVATKTIERFVAHAVQLYEQEWEEPSGSSQRGLYVRRWHRWVRCIASEKTFANQ
jgi:hypothetical protein